MQIALRRWCATRSRRSFVLLLASTCTPSSMADETCTDDLPASYLTEKLEPQGTHKLWVEGNSGPPQVSTKLFSPGNTLGTGLWECTPGSWHITRSTTESFLVLKGKATITNADGSMRAALTPGVWHTTPASWSGHWEVHETVRKLFVLTP